jgi:hypothetical protein
MTLTTLKETIARANSVNNPGLLFEVLSEDTIWLNSVFLLDQGADEDVIFLIRGIDQAFDAIKVKDRAASFIIGAMTSNSNHLIYEAAVSAILNHAAGWSQEIASALYDTLETAYRRLVTIQEIKDTFVTRCALEGMVLLPVYRGDKQLLLSAQGTLVNRFPPLLATLDELDYLAVRATQLLSHCYDANPQEAIAEKIKELTLSINLEIASEAYFAWGSVCLYDAFRSQTEQDLSYNLQQAQDAFQESSQARENRTDADLLFSIIDCYLAVLSSDWSRINESIHQANYKLVERITMLGEVSELREETARFQLIQLLIHLKRWAETLVDATRWPSLHPPMEKLAQVYAAIRELSIESTLIGHASITTKELVLLPKLQSQFLQVQEIQSKLQENLADPTWRETTPSSTIEFYKLALDLIAEREYQKNEFAANWETRLAAIEESNPDLGQKLKQVRDTGGDKNALISVLLADVERSQYQMPFPLSGAAKEIYKNLLTALQPQLNWPAASDRRRYLEYAIGSVAHYFVETNKLNIPDAKFLFNEQVGGLGQKAGEQDLQNHFYNKMHMSAGVKVEYEPNQITPGRPDLALRYSDDIIFPIEVKCEKKDVRRENIHRKYIAQSQHFAASLSQVGFLFVLDTTPKQAAVPVKYNLDYCYLDSYEVAGHIHSVCVIVIIFEANRYRPSDHTRYAKRKY